MAKETRTRITTALLLLAIIATFCVYYIKWLSPDFNTMWPIAITWAVPAIVDLTLYAIYGDE